MPTIGNRNIVEKFRVRLIYEHSSSDGTIVSPLIRGLHKKCSLSIVYSVCSKCSLFESKVLLRALFVSLSLHIHSLCIANCRVFETDCVLVSAHVFFHMVSECKGCKSSSADRKASEQDRDKFSHFRKRKDRNMYRGMGSSLPIEKLDRINYTSWSYKMHQ